MQTRNRRIMAKRYFLFLGLFAVAFFGGVGTVAQDDTNNIHVNVVLVQLNVAVTDRKGNYISGLRPEDFSILEDNIPQKTATFEEGNEPTRRLINIGGAHGPAEAADAATQASIKAGDAAGQANGPNIFSGGANVFILFDTSNYMYRGFVFAQDAIADFIRTLPAGFDEPVRERGATLSTGQKQLISFARALAHAPEILILDEATSSVDTDTEHRVRLALSRMITGRTSVLIAHRLSTVQSADTILVMHKGQLREQGTHQELLAHRGLYWKLYQLQYKDQELGEPAHSPALIQPA